MVRYYEKAVHMYSITYKRKFRETLKSVKFLKTQMFRVELFMSVYLSSELCHTKKSFPYVCARAVQTSSQIKLNLMSSLISCCLWWMLLPLHCFIPQTIILPRELASESKWFAIGNPVDGMRILCKWSLKRSRSGLPVSLM